MNRFSVLHDLVEPLLARETEEPHIDIPVSTSHWSRIYPYRVHVLSFVGLSPPSYCRWNRFSHFRLRSPPYCTIRIQANKVGRCMRPIREAATLNVGGSASGFPTYTYFTASSVNKRSTRPGRTLVSALSHAINPANQSISRYSPPVNFRWSL